MIATGLDRLLEDAGVLAGRRYGVLGHAAAVSSTLLPVQLALARAGAELPQRMFGPEHGFFGMEQDMVASADETDPWLGVPIVSLYGDSVASLRPRSDAFDGLDLVVIDFQDVGSRYYTYAATAVWAAEVALGAGLEVWILDRPNPLGGVLVEGNLREDGLDSFIGAFPAPVRHGLTLGELAHWALADAGVEREALRVWRMTGWRRSMRWSETGRPWISPSPNVPTAAIAAVYPGGCLVEGTNVSEGRGTTRPFELVGAPGIEPRGLADRLNESELPGTRFIPAFFKPQFHKHSGTTCGGVQWVVEDPETFSPYRCGVALVSALAELDPGFAWRTEPYEFVTEHPAIDLLAGSRALRTALDAGDDVDDWLEGWAADERSFIAATDDHLLYEGERQSVGGRR
jgi:uncharacterized protein YbbC (DUF1343 family)